MRLPPELGGEGGLYKTYARLAEENGSEVLDRIYFKNCTETVQKIIYIVAEYMPEE